MSVSSLLAVTAILGGATDPCPSPLTLLETFEHRGEAWAACEDLQTPDGALALVPSTGGKTEWFHKGHHVYGSASDDDYYLNLTKRAAVANKTDVLAVKLLSMDVTWVRVASAVPPIRKAGVRTFVGSRGSVADTTFNDAGEDAAGYGFPPPLAFVFNQTWAADLGPNRNPSNRSAAPHTQPPLCAGAGTLPRAARRSPTAPSTSIAA